MSSFKGVLGETVINVAMWLKLEKEVYHRLNNITLPLPNGGSTQIDHIIVSVHGIFVIETKNYKGWIYGNEKQRQWTQVFANGRKYKFQNPLRQNYLHIKSLADLLDLEMSYFHSMIAFIGECELKTRNVLPENVLTSGMASYVKTKQEVILTGAEVKSIVEQIENNRYSKSWRTNREHKAYLKDKHSGSNSPANKPSSALKPKEEVEASYTQNVSVEPKKRDILKSREVAGWSGQTLQANESFVVSEKEEAFYITPFELPESEIKAKVNSQSDNQINESKINIVANNDIMAKQIPNCPRCGGEMVERVAKKGARQGQSFYGCSQFPKCRGVMNVSEFK